jgi:hypothetical protein
MKLKMLICAIAAAALTTSAAVAAPPAGKGNKPATTGTGCKPTVTLVLHGTVAAAPGSSPTLPFQLMVTVTSTNSLGKHYVNTTPAGITVSSATRVSRQGSHSLSSLLANDKVTIQAATCKADLANGATPALTARMVSAHPASA